MPAFKSAILGGGSDKKGDKKEATAEAPDTNKDVDIPDELPSLAEESVKPPEEPIAEKSEVAPEDLPAISPDIEKKISESGEKDIDELPLGPEEEEEKRLREYISTEIKKGFGLDEIKDVLLKAGHPEKYVTKIIEEFKKKEQAPKEPQKIAEPLPEQPKEKLQKPELKLSKKPGFFSNMLKMILKHDEAKEQLLSGDLFARMKDDWKIREKEHKEEITLTSEQQLRTEMTNRLKELEDLENVWQIQKSVIETESQKLAEKEKVIKEKIHDLRKVLKKLEFYKNVDPDHYFRFINGVVVKNLQELIDMLKVIDEHTFKHHVNVYRSDISAWIHNAVKNEDIAARLADVKSREAIINILEGIKELKD